MAETTDFKTLLAASLKSPDTEEKFDLILFRPLGLWVALFAKKMSITPNMLTFIGIFFGVLAGHLFYYNDIAINIIGIVFLMMGSTLDSADGQLARMTNQTSQLGRVLDGVGGYLWFVSIYIHLILRFYPESNNVLFIDIPVISILSHAFQSMMADYYRNAHMFFVFGKGEFENASDVKFKNDEDDTNKSGIAKLFGRIYHVYTGLQENITKNLQTLSSIVNIKFNGTMPDDIKAKYRAFSRPLQKYCNGLTLNTRFFAIYLTLFFNNFYIYLIYEVVVLNVLVFYLIRKHESECAKLNVELTKA